MNATVNKNHNASPIDAAIAGIMDNAKSSLNKQADLIVAMFQSEATFTRDALVNVFQLAGKERTEFIDNLIAQVSHTYAGKLQSVAELQETLKASKRKDVNAAQAIAAITAQIKAGRIMFVRACEAVLGLRESGAIGVKVEKKSSGSVIRYMGTVAGDDGKPEKDEAGNVVRVLERATNAELGRLGAKTREAILGKRQNATANDPRVSAGSLANVAKQLGDFLDVASKNAVAPVHCIEDFDDGTGESLKNTFNRLLHLMFADDSGVLDEKLAAAYVAGLNDMHARKIKAAKVSAAK